MQRDLGLLLIAVGAAAVVLGVLVLTGTAGAVTSWLGSWFGRLPGDIRIERDGTRVFIPITSALVVSAVLTILVNVVLRLLR